ncbi:MAG: S8 family serine peptidase [Anaerolineae bacterium]|nr:S8 family serine peptidase [Anaerolineae bacterium]NIN96312.1 S8 family serine peptidase [Anaerolineae bacterium]
MKRMLALLATAALLAVVFSVPVAAEDTPSRYVVVFAGNGLPKDAGKIIQSAGGTLVSEFPRIGTAIATSSSPAFGNALQRSNKVHAVGLERYQVLPELEVQAFVEQPTATDFLYFLYQWDIRRVKADMAWPTNSGSHDTVVAIIDTGIAWNHPDLAPNVVYAACFRTTPGCSPYPDLHWHGTHVAGTVAAAFDGGWTVGVGPNLGLASYNVFEYVPGVGVVAFDSAIWAAMMDAAEEDFDVINMSLGGYVVMPLSQEDVAAWTAWLRMAQYINRKGITIVASAGNANLDLNGPVAHIPSDVPGVISVGATGIRPYPFYPWPDAYDVRASYSNFGAAVTISAPGGDLGPESPPAPYWWYLVMSTYVIIDPVCAATQSCFPWYAWAGGTSMASPHVAGAAGLVKDQDPGLNPHQVEAILTRSAESLGDRQQFGHGMVDVAAAVAEA